MEATGMDADRPVRSIGYWFLFSMNWFAVFEMLGSDLSDPNKFFFSGILAAFSLWLIYGNIIGEEYFAAVFPLYAISFFLLWKNGYYDFNGIHNKTDNLLNIFFRALIFTVALGPITSGICCVGHQLFMSISDMQREQRRAKAEEEEEREMRRARARWEREQAEKKAKASGKSNSSSSRQSGTRGDDGFGYDEKKFHSKAETKKPHEWPRQKRHPADAKLWAVVDEPTSAPNERMTAMKKITEREAARKAAEA